jgi:branched-chain amino acid transport system substrate-binding protein
MARRALILALSMGLGLGLAACGGGEGGAAAGDEIVIGEYGSLTGSDATFGISTKNGIDMAIEEVNAAGGVLGKQVRVIVEDDRGDPAEATTVVTKLINSDKVVALLGEVASTRSLAGAPVAQQAGIPMVTPSSTNQKVTEVGDMIFRVCFIDPFQGLVMAKFTTNTLKKKNVAILRDIKSDYSVGLADVYKAELTKMGGTIVADESYGSGDTDFAAQLTAIKAKNPEAIFIPGYYTDVGLIAKQARSAGITAPLLGGDGWDSSSLGQIGGTAIEGAYFSTHYSPDDPSPAIQNFVTAYKAKFGETPDGNAALAYDAAKILFDAMTRAGSTDGPAVRDALAKTANYQGVTGVITLDANRNATKPAVVLQVIAGGGYKFVETIAPDGAPGAPADSAAPSTADSAGRGARTP